MQRLNYLITRWYWRNVRWLDYFLAFAILASCFVFLGMFFAYAMWGWKPWE